MLEKTVNLHLRNELKEGREIEQDGGGDWEPQKDLIGKPGDQRRQTLNKKKTLQIPNTENQKQKRERKALVIKTFLKNPIHANLFPFYF